MSELAQRTWTAVALFALVLAWYRYAPETAFLLGLLLIAGLALTELWRMVAMPFWPAHLACSLAALGLLVDGNGWPWLPLLALLSWALVVVSARTGVLILAPWLAAWWTAIWLLLTTWILVIGHADVHGRLFIAAICFAVWASDICAYVIGRRIGRHRLCPAISPGKTTEGLGAGLLLGTLVGGILLWQWQLTDGATAFGLALLATLAGVLGDLSESALKRLLDVKDSGRLLPGHGGLLDRIDAMLMAVPVSFLVWRSMA